MLKLRRVLDSEGITVQGFASLVGVCESAARNKLTGATDFTYGETLKIKAMLPKYNIDYLLTSEEERA